MRRLTDIEESALAALRRYGSWCPGENAFNDSAHELLASTLKVLAKRGRIRVEDTQDGPRYHAV